VKAKTFLVAVNKQLVQAPQNPHALLKLKNTLNKLLKSKTRPRRADASCGGLSYTHAYSIATTGH
jgi:hypothetical protein